MGNLFEFRLVLLNQFLKLWLLRAHRILLLDGFALRSHLLPPLAGLFLLLH